MASETDNVSATDSCSVTVPIKGVGGKGGRAGAHNPMMMMMNGDAESTGTTDDHFIELSINATSGLKVPKPIKTDGFDSYWEFLLAALSYAVGLGNIWRFPYLVYRNGGGAFLIPWLVMLFLIGIPLFVLEFSFGQYMQTSPVNVWKVAPLFCGIGYAMAAMSALVAVYYNMIIAWAMRYFITSIFQNIYWDSCVNAWNTDGKQYREVGFWVLAVIIWFAFSLHEAPGQGVSRHGRHDALQRHLCGAHVSVGECDQHREHEPQPGQSADGERQHRVRH